MIISWCKTNNSQVNLATVVQGNQKAPFSLATALRCGDSATLFPWLLYFLLDPHLIMLSVKQRGIKYHFF